MQIATVKINNFRLLKDIEIDFSFGVKPLTVIRAENESGKTTFLTALQWGMFGDEALPQGGKDFRIHPIDWDCNNGIDVKIKVEIVFKHTWEREVNGIFLQEITDYMLSRTVIEKITGKDTWKREQSVLSFFKIADSGYEEVKNPDLVLKQIMGSNLKEIFFTDGDRTLSFITSDLSNKERRSLVKNSIRDMLSFELLEKARLHLGKTITDIRNEVKDCIKSDELSSLSDDVEKLNHDIESNEKEITEKNKEIAAAIAQIEVIDSAIEEKLKKGNKEELSNELKDKKTRLEKNRELLNKIKHEHAMLLQNDTLTKILLYETMEQTYSQLDTLKRKGKIPKTSLPALQECLDLGECICGTKLLKGTLQRDTILNLIEQKKTEEDLEDRVLGLRYKLQGSLIGYQELCKLWFSDLNDNIQKHHETESTIQQLEENVKALEIKIDNLGDVDIDDLKKRKKDLQSIKDDLLKKKTLLESQIGNDSKNLKNKTTELNLILSKQGKAESVMAKVKAANDVLQVINSTYDEIEKNEIPKVSDKMDEYFITMIRSDPKQNSIIMKAKINNEYDIVVYGPNRHSLHPDNDLNGASRRALTLSFVLSLTKVSGVIAPLVIDTPLGMMDPLIKKSVLEVLCNNTTQLVLFLTRSEIRDCEELLDDYCGKTTTLSNSAHYPKSLVNQPKIDGRFIIQCSCNHREYCKHCERIGDKQNKSLNYID